jgi:spermidine synthase
VAARLEPGGLFCQWLPLYQLDERTLEVIAATFVEVYEPAHAWLLRLNLETPVLGLIGTPRALGSEAARALTDMMSVARIERRLQDPALREALRAVGLGDPYQLLSLWVPGYIPALRNRLAGSWPNNTDDLPQITFLAPRGSSAGSVSAYGTLFRLLEGAGPGPGRAPELPRGSETDRDRLWACLEARDRYLEGLRFDAELRSGEAVARYLESARVSPDFTLGYSHVITMALQVSEDRPELARQWLERLAEVRPEVPVARELMDRLPR